MKQILYLFLAVVIFTLILSPPRCSSKTEVKIDTIQSEPIVITKVKVDTQYILSPTPYIAWIDRTDTINIDGCKHLREYKEYKDSNYYAKISGVSPRLDEIRIYPKTVYRTEYIYRDIIKTKPARRLGLGISAGYGAGKSGLTPYIGIGINYRIW